MFDEMFGVLVEDIQEVFEVAGHDSESEVYDLGYAVAEGLSIVTEPERIPSVSHMRKRQVTVVATREVEKTYRWGGETYMVKETYWTKRDETSEEFLKRLSNTGEAQSCFCSPAPHATLSFFHPLHDEPTQEDVTSQLLRKVRDIRWDGTAFWPKY